MLPAVQQAISATQAKMSRSEPNYVMHYYLAEGKPHLTPIMLGSHVTKSVKAAIGTNLSVLRWDR